jgi:hypothetical protein
LPLLGAHDQTPRSYLAPLDLLAGLFGGPQPEIFLSGPDLRREPISEVDGLTRVLDMTRVDNLRDPAAEPVIDKCSSWMQPIGEDEIELAIKWRDRNCTDSFDQEETIGCRSRATFRFSRRDLGMEEVLNTVEDLDAAAMQRLLVVDAYFTQEVQPRGHHSATGMPLPETGIVHLVLRVKRAPPVDSSKAATPVDAVLETRSRC